MSRGVATRGLTPAQERLLTVVQDLPEGPLRLRLDAFLGDLAGFLEHPGCPEMQADGVPCSTPSASCEECQQLAQTVDRLRVVVNRG